MSPATKAAREAVAAFLEQRFGLPRANYTAMAADICTLPELRAAFAGEWMPIDSAPMDDRRVLLHFRDPVPNTREDLRKYDGQTIVGHFTSESWGYGISLGGVGGFPRAWFDGWQHLPTPPSEPSNG